MLTGANKALARRRTSRIYLPPLIYAAFAASYAVARRRVHSYSKRSQGARTLTRSILLFPNPPLDHYAAITSTKAGCRPLPDLEHAYGTHWPIKRAERASAAAESGRSRRAEHRTPHVPIQEAAVRASVSGALHPPDQLTTQACKSRKVRCVDADKPPCKACRVSRIACEFPERSVRRKRNPQPANNTGDQQQALEARLRRIEAALRLPPLDGSDNSESEEEMEPPRFKLGGSDLTVFHGETSMHDDATDPSPKASNHPDSGGPSGPQFDAAWTPEDIRALTRLRHKYASPDEGEAFIDAYFCWASPSIAVVNRSIFLRDMAVNGPFFSDLLLLVIYVSGLRFSPNIDAAERKAKGERYMGIIMSLIAEDLQKPSSIVTAQALLSLSGTRSAVGDQTLAWMLAGMGIRMIQDVGGH